MKVLITGVAGFVGFYVARRLIKEGCKIIGIDNLNDYYDVSLKKDRLKLLNDPRFNYYKIDIRKKQNISKIFEKYKPHYVINLAAQAGVRYSLISPQTYIQDNVLGFCNILEMCKDHAVKHLVYASSSSVYGKNNKIPFSENQNTDTPINIYAASKKSNELMAFSYSHLYNLKCTGLRFFTVYGPWGRPDMAYYKFVHSIINNLPIDVYNFGNSSRDFTYIDDIIEGVMSALDLKNNRVNNNLCEIYNLGNNNSVKVLDFIKIIENLIKKKAKKNFIQNQLGDMDNTYACLKKSKNELKFEPKIKIDEGLKNFVNWYKSYHC